MSYLMIFDVNCNLLISIESYRVYKNMIEVMKIVGVI